MWNIDMAVDRDVWSFTTDMVPPEDYSTGCLVESWEIPDGQTVIAHIREGVYWQDKEPVNGREFTAYDVAGPQALLAEAAADGVFTANAEGGFDTNVVASSTSDLQLLQILQNSFEDIGVDMTIDEYDSATWESLVAAGEFDQMVYASCAYSTYPTIINHRWSGNATSNYTYNNNSVYDEIREGFLTATTGDEARQAMQAADQRAIEQHWSVNLFPTATFIAWQPYLKGYSGESKVYFGGQWLLAHLWIEQD